MHLYTKSRLIFSLIFFKHLVFHRPVQINGEKEDREHPEFKGLDGDIIRVGIRFAAGKGQIGSA